MKGRKTKIRKSNRKKRLSGFRSRSRTAAGRRLLKRRRKRY
ncbi:MAG: 50S ribosomal protein L34, partial [Planctomycetes bacterium]|nr:50S ribosomal protein L34 [Planctomycetota bacterium]